jgi:hypothetical protein
VEHTWGASSIEEVTQGRRVDVVIACDVMYVREAVPALVATLCALCRAGRCGSSAPCSPPGPDGDRSTQADAALQEEQSIPATRQQGTLVIVAHGRNRFAEEEFCTCAGKAGFDIQRVPFTELHPDYQADDVDVYHLHLAIDA